MYLLLKKKVRLLVTIVSTIFVLMIILHALNSGTTEFSHHVGANYSAPPIVQLPVAKFPSTMGENLPDCPEKPERLSDVVPDKTFKFGFDPEFEVGSVPILQEPQTVAQLEEKFSFMGLHAGTYHPPDCRPGQKVAIIIPFLNRWYHLHVLLRTLLSVLQRQKAAFTIFVIEQDTQSIFNKGVLYNAGILEASLRDNYDCFILHDVDLIPLSDINFYQCSTQPVQLTVTINKFNYVPIANFGGVVALSRDQLEKVNGASNLFFGWGGEDDDLHHRVLFTGMKVLRPPNEIGLYNMIRHERDHMNTDNRYRFLLMKNTKRRMGWDGLNSLLYNVSSVELKPLYTWIKVRSNPLQYLPYLPSDIKELVEKSLSSNSTAASGVQTSFQRRQWWWLLLVVVVVMVVGWSGGVPFLSPS